MNTCLKLSTQLEKADYLMTFISFILVIGIQKTNIGNKTYLYFCLICALITRGLQYTLVIQNLQNKQCSLSVATLFSNYVTHFCLFYTLYHLNYAHYGIYGFSIPGGPTPGSEIDIKNNSMLSAVNTFEENINLNLSYFVFSVTSTVGFGDLYCASPFGKIISMIQMLDGAFVMGVILSRLVDAADKTPN